MEDQIDENNQALNELVAEHVFHMDNRLDIPFDRSFVDIANMFQSMVLYLSLIDERDFLLVNFFIANNKKKT